MPKKTISIPVNKMTDFGDDISIERFSLKDLNDFDEPIPSHRHDRHSFFLIEKGTGSIEIDFQKHEIESCSILYMHPDQVHRIIAFKNVTVSSLAINNENVHAEYLALLESIKPTKPLLLEKEIFSVIAETILLCMKFFKLKSGRLYQSVLKDSCNTFIALFISQYLEQPEATGKSSRFQIVTRNFKEILERHYATIKRPAVYAQMLHLSSAYLNECVKNVTGHSVSQYIQQRVILEAKRLLYYSNHSVKEVAAELGYDDYTYFSRLFTKVTGMTALSFRKQKP